MALNKATGDMYTWITHTHNPLGGDCPNDCEYCSTKDGKRRFRTIRNKYSGTIRLIENELKVKYGRGKIIFMVNCRDLFAKGVILHFIMPVLEHACKWPDNTYVWQTKNPARFLEIDPSLFPPKSIYGTTIETNRDYLTKKIGAAPSPSERMLAMCEVRSPKFVTIEPIMDFDVNVLADWLVKIKPDFINIGADSKKHNLPEPSSEKINALIDKIKKMNGTELRIKDNLARLMG